MDVVKLLWEEPVGLEALVPDGAADARNRAAEAVSLEALLAPDGRPYARAYVAGTILAEPRRVGATALGDPEAWIGPVLAWAGPRPWTALGADGATRGLIAAEAAARLRQPDGIRALALGPVAPGDLAEAAGGERREALPALRRLLDGGAAVLFPEPAHDGSDWSLFARAPLREPLAAAFRAQPAPEARRLMLPYRRARGEHTFYLEQWALDSLPDWAETL